MAPTSNTLLRNPRLQPVVPLILAAWDDEFLSPAELLKIREALERAAGDDESAKLAVREWLDPAAPPSPESLRTLRRAWWQAPLQPSAAEESGLRGVRRLLDLPLGAAEQTGHPDRLAPAAQADIARWRGLLDGRFAQTRDEVRSQLGGPRFRVPRQSEMHAYRQQVFEWLLALSELPVLVRAGSEAPGRALGEFLAAFETIAQFDLSLVVKFGVQFGLFANSIQNLGSARQQALLPAIRRCEIIGCFAMTERAHGSNVRSIETLARYDAATQEFEIHSPSLAAGKEWIGNAALHAQRAVVFAQLQTGGEAYGVHAFLVPIRDDAGNMLAGVRAEDCGHKMGLNGVDNGRLWFDHVRVPRDALLDRFGQVSPSGEYSSPIPSEGKRFFTMLGTLVGGRINAAGGALAASKVGLAIALRYGALRRQFPNEQGTEQPIGDYLTHRLRLLPALANAYAYSFAQHALIERVLQAESDPDAGREIGTLAAGLKAIGTWRAIATLQNCRECCGGQGYLTSNRIDVLRTDADVFATFEGDNSVLCQLVAKDLLRDYAREFEDSPLRTLAADVSASLAQKSPLATRRSGADDLLDPEFHTQALRYRERSLVASLARRIQRRREEGLSAQAALEACQDHALSLARAHVEAFALTSFQRASEGDDRLRKLCGLYGLSVIESDLGWFVEQDYVAPNKARAIRKQVRALLGDVAAMALPLVEAFAIPNGCLGPLADPSFLAASGLIPS